jgi:biopolymer transport protein ExbD
VNSNVQASIKGDGKTEFPVVKKVLDIFGEKNVYRFNLITNLEAIKETEGKTQQ